MKTTNIRTVTLDTIAELPVHPVAGIFPMLPDEVRRDDGKVKTITLAELADSILLNGLQEPIVLFNGGLLDGRNRRAACVKAAKATKTPHEEFEVLVEDFIGTDEEAEEYILDLNLDRRDLDPTQRAIAAMQYFDLLSPGKGARRDLQPGPNLAQVRTAEELSLRFRVSTGYIKEARRRQKEADGIREQAETAAREAERKALEAEEEQLKAEKARAIGDEAKASEHFQASNAASNKAAEERERAAEKAVEAASKQNTLDRLRDGKTNFSQIRNESKKGDEDNPVAKYRIKINTACSNIKDAISELVKASGQGEDDYQFIGRKLGEITEHFYTEFGVED